MLYCGDIITIDEEIMVSSTSPTDSSVFRAYFENKQALARAGISYLPIDAWVKIMSSQTVPPLDASSGVIDSPFLGKPDKISHLIIERAKLYGFQSDEIALVKQAKLAQEFIKKIFGMVRTIKVGEIKERRYQIEYEQWLLDPTKILSPDIVESRGAKVLIEASELGYDLVVKRLLESGVPINSTDGMGNTALMLAAENGHIGIVERLLLEGALVDSVTYTKTALMRAAANGHVGIV
ncbi:MAG: ankyrin repeat domain-containing protein, partial [Simkaniaceae bacterium]|nr:ankyrin repeat domain-containing protein [Simkaniaceae bacterium]